MLLYRSCHTAKERFRNCDFNIGVASALTLGSHEQQDAFLEKYGRDIRITPDLARNAMINEQGACLEGIVRGYTRDRT